MYTAFKVILDVSLYWKCFSNLFLNDCCYNGSSCLNTSYQLVYDLQKADVTFISSRASPFSSSFACLQKLQQELEFLEVQEEYIKDEQKNLKKEFLHAQEEVKRIQSIPLVIGQFLEAVDQNTAIVGSTTGTIRRNK